jgi:hypothetical protein
LSWLELYAYPVPWEGNDGRAGSPQVHHRHLRPERQHQDICNRLQQRGAGAQAHRSAQGRRHQPREVRGASADGGRQCQTGADHRNHI